MRRGRRRAGRRGGPHRLARRGVWLAGLGAVALTAVAGWRLVDHAALAAAWDAAWAAPLATAGVLAVYAGAFGLRAGAWRRLLPELPLGHALAGIHLAVAGNHVLPARLGEPLRVASAVRRAGVPAAAATASTVTLRAGDLAGLAALGLVVGGAGVGGPAPLPRWGLVLAGVPLAAAAAGVWWLRRQRRAGGARIRLPGPGVVAATTAAWLLESVVVWHAAQLAGVDLSAAQAVAVTAATVAGQVLALAPAGFGTYEAAGTAALVAVGVDPATGLAIAVVAHALKTVYALAAGAVAAVRPSPGLLGRLRLPRRVPAAPPADAPAPPDAPVVLFLPARDEEATVASVVRRVPARVAGRPVRCVVVDDGSRDATAGEAAAAGAEVVAHHQGRGLGAAVRTGLAAALAHQPAAVAFCDADGEYAPEELGALVAPVLAGEADYVVGSRFAGRIERMRPHRRAGNRLLTRVLAVVARQPVSDGQSGYRALSPRAAADGDIAHDFNYAQVLTLDLLAKGHRYAEAPITYRFRAHGRSFVRLLPYLRAVLPAVWQVVNRAPAAPAAGRPAPEGAARSAAPARAAPAPGG